MSYRLDPNDPGTIRGGSEPPVFALRCAVCEWQIRLVGYGVAGRGIAAAKHHILDHPTHDILYRGVKQAWAHNQAARTSEDAQRFHDWLGSSQTTLQLRRMVADNQRMDDENGGWQ